MLFRWIFIHVLIHMCAFNSVSCTWTGKCQLINQMTDFKKKDSWHLQLKPNSCSLAARFFVDLHHSVAAREGGDLDEMKTFPMHRKE